MINRFLAACLIAGSTLGACGLVPATCDVVIWGGGEALPAVGDPVPSGIQPLVAPADIDWASSRLETAGATTVILTLVLRPQAATRVASFTRANLGASLPIGLNNRVVLVPQYLHPVDAGTIKVARDANGAAALEPFRTCVGR